jgi:hypothetical protein
LRSVRYLFSDKNGILTRCIGIGHVRKNHVNIADLRKKQGSLRTTLSVVLIERVFLQSFALFAKNSVHVSTKSKNMPRFFELISFIFRCLDSRRLYAKWHSPDHDIHEFISSSILASNFVLEVRRGTDKSLLGCRGKETHNAIHVTE